MEFPSACCLTVVQISYPPNAGNQEIEYYSVSCDGMVERFNRTLKSMLRKHAARFGKQWDRFLSGVLYAYRNTPHESTGEKPSYLLFGTDLRSPTEAAFLTVSSTVRIGLDSSGRLSCGQCYPQLVRWR